MTVVNRGRCRECAAARGMAHRQSCSQQVPPAEAKALAKAKAEQRAWNRRRQPACGSSAVHGAHNGFATTRGEPWCSGVAAQ
jgi:hypothetical protein